MYGSVVLYLFEAPRASAVAVAEDTTVYSASYGYKYGAAGVLGLGGVLGIIWYLADYGEEQVAFRPIDFDLEKSRTPALPRSAV
jgi:hypothetical protein